MARIVAPKEFAKSAVERFSPELEKVSLSSPQGKRVARDFVNETVTGGYTGHKRIREGGAGHTVWATSEIEKLVSRLVEHGRVASHKPGTELNPRQLQSLRNIAAEGWRLGAKHKRDYL